MPRTEPEARAVYQRQRDQAQAQAQPLAGLAPQAGQVGADGTNGQHARINFLALVLCLMLGTAGMPHILMRSYTTPSVIEARKSVCWSLLFILLLYFMAPALALLVKYEVYTQVVGSSFLSLPNWVHAWSAVDSNLLDVTDVNRDGIVQLAELRLGADMIVLAAPELGGLPLVVTYLVAAGGLAAALSTADGLLLTISNALSHDFFFRVVRPNASAIKRVMFSKLMVLITAVLAAWVASLRITAILPFVSAAFSLAAATFFPALVMGIFWRRANRAGAVAGMLAGAGLCLWYMARNTAGPRAFFGLGEAGADLRWFGIDPVAAGVFGVPVGCMVLVLVSLLTRPTGAEERAVAERLRQPDPWPTEPTRSGPPSAL
jgi:cation/acetate symporter